jgi:hypothetical protein
MRDEATDIVGGRGGLRSSATHPWDGFSVDANGSLPLAIS